jgi:hypothetical protein
MMRENLKAIHKAQYKGAYPNQRKNSLKWKYALTKLKKNMPNKYDKEG